MMRTMFRLRTLAVLCAVFGVFAVGIVPAAAQDEGDPPVIDTGTPIDNGEIIDDGSNAGTGGTSGEVAELPITGSGDEAGSGSSAVFVLGTMSLLVLAAACVWHQRRSA